MTRPAEKEASDEDADQQEWKDKLGEAPRLLEPVLACTRLQGGGDAQPEDTGSDRELRLVGQGDGEPSGNRRDQRDPPPDKPQSKDQDEGGGGGAQQAPS